MDGESYFGDVLRRVKELAKHLACACIDCMFVILWVKLQCFASSQLVIDALKLDRFDRWGLWVLRVMFGVATLVPVVLYIYADLMLMWRRTQQSLSGRQFIPPEATLNATRELIGKTGTGENRGHRRAEHIGPADEVQSDG